MSDPYRDASSRTAETEGSGGNAKPWELRTWQSERPCPECAIPLFAAAKDGYRIDACGQCGGSWIEHGDVRRMIDTSSKTPIELARVADSVVAKAPEAAHARECPECKRALGREVLAGVEIDVCDAHGTWFDRHELEQVAVALLKEYGLARRVADASAEEDRERRAHADDISLTNVAVGVATLSLALVGAAINLPNGPTPNVNTVMNRDLEINALGEKVLKRTRGL